jgi:predicted outer membrane repeat protein
MDNVVIKDNWAQSNGAGMSVWGTAHAVVQNAAFYNNTSYGGCGGIYAYAHSVTQVTQAVFTNNVATGSVGGGAIGVWGDAYVNLADASMANSTAAYAGAIDVERNATFRMHSVTLSGNTAAQSGGGLYVASNCHAFLTSCTLANNTAQEKDGGAVFSSHLARVNIVDSIFIGNRASQGGGVYNLNSSVHLEASHFLANIASLQGGCVRWEQCNLHGC